MVVPKSSVPMTLLPRDLCARLGHEAVAIIDAGGYVGPSGQRIELAAMLEAARRGTVEYSPGVEPAAPPVRAGARTQFSVENATVLEVGRRMAEAGPVAALNFASATSPGGGFLSGARAQEESIARSSGLFHCLNGRAMYADQRSKRNAMYADHVVYSRDVPVFRTDAGYLHEPCRLSEVPAVMRVRTEKVLAVAEAHAHPRLILGAWGCGAFGLDPGMMAGVFDEALSRPLVGVFDEIVFAITDWSEARQFIGPFERRFADRVRYTWVPWVP
jgi:hypothetical protein